MAQHLNRPTEKEKRRALRQKQTFLEKVMWTHLRNRNFMGIKFRRQYSVDQYILDFYAPEIKLAIELDGDYHNSPEQQAYDQIRQAHIEGFGITFCRISNEEYQGNPEQAFRRIAAAVALPRTSPLPLSLKGEGFDER